MYIYIMDTIIATTLKYCYVEIVKNKPKNQTDLIAIIIDFFRYYSDDGANEILGLDSLNLEKIVEDTVKKHLIIDLSGSFYDNPIWVENIMKVIIKCVELVISDQQQSDIGHFGL